MLDLFSGIGGFPLAAKWVWGNDLEIVSFCEVDKYCQKVLRKNFPGVQIHNDIQKLDGNLFKNIDLITGGFPCQDISISGKGKGLEGEKSGLWSEMYRIIGEVRPRYALIENVPMLTVRGGTRVVSDLTKLGYDSEWQVISARYVGAPHLRYRFWLVCYPQHTNSDSIGPHREKVNIIRNNEFRYQQNGDSGQIRKKVSQKNAVCNPISLGLEGVEWRRDGEKPEDRYMGVEKNVPNTNGTGLKERWWEKPAPEKLDSPEYISKRFRESEWSAEPDFCRVAYGIPNRVDRIRGLGNAVVPKVAQMIMEMIKCHSC